jgi:hydroxyacylglutathione hydrolase
MGSSRCKNQVQAKLPTPFCDNQAQGLTLDSRSHPVVQFEIGTLRNFVYLLIDWKNGDAWIVDPQRDLLPIQQALQSAQLKLTGILLTHTHHDHIAGIEPLLKWQPDLPIWVHPLDAFRLERLCQEQPKICSNLRHFSDQETLRIGALEIQALHTPGHSAGGSCFLIEASPPFLLSGDTLFIGDCGRTDLETGSVAQMFESLTQLKSFPKNTVILPGHHYALACASTLEEELQSNLALQAKSVEELSAIP